MTEYLVLTDKKCQYCYHHKAFNSCKKCAGTGRVLVSFEDAFMDLLKQQRIKIELEVADKEKDKKAPKPSTFFSQELPEEDEDPSARYCDRCQVELTDQEVNYCYDCRKALTDGDD